MTELIALYILLGLFTTLSLYLLINNSSLRDELEDERQMLKLHQEISHGLLHQVNDQRRTIDNMTTSIEVLHEEAR